MRPSRGLATTAFVGFLTLAAACGGTADGSGVPSVGGGMTMRPSGMHDGGMMGGGAAADDCHTVGGGEVALAAEGLAYDTPCIEALAGGAFTIVFENRDGAPHDVVIEDASGMTVFDGENVTRGTIDYDVPALDAGEYPFHCRVHPDMRGVVRVG